MGGLPRHRIDSRPWRVEEREDIPVGRLRDELEALHAAVFGAEPTRHAAGADVSPDRVVRGMDHSMDLAGRLGHRARVHIALARVGHRLVGFKIGYERKPGHFESWLGGVAPDQRGQGIASELMRRQHTWCRAHGYRIIRTLTTNRWRDMLILDLRHGFDIVGSYTDRRGEPRLILERRLIPGR